MHVPPALAATLVSALFGAATLAAGTAVAETALHEHGRDAEGVALGLRPASQLYEAACDVDVQLRGAVATVEVRQRLVNPGPGALAARYDLDLPPGAVITGLALRGAGGTTEALPVPAAHATIAAVEGGVLGADPAVITLRPPGAASTHTLHLQPIAPDDEVVVTTRYTALAEVRAGALRLVLPGRSTRGKLTACRGTARAAAGPGTRITRLLVDGIEPRARGAAAFTIDAAPVVLDAELGFTGTAPVVWSQTEPLGEGWAATLVTVAAPPVRAAPMTGRRVLFVLDRSRSMELVGRAQVTRVIRAVAAALPVGAEVEAITFDRAAKRTLGGWRPADAAAITAIEQAVTSGDAINGSDVRGALALAHTVLDDGRREPALLVLISDGVLGEVTGRDLTAALAGTPSSLDALSIVLDPRHARSPGSEALAAPARLLGGALVEVSVDDLAPALTTVDEWLRPAWMDLALSGGLDAPGSVRAGSGFTRLRVHRTGGRPIVLTSAVAQAGAHAGDAPLRVTARPGPAAPIAALALAASALTDLGDVPAAAGDGPAAVARTRLERAHPAVTLERSLAVLTMAGKVARSRRAMVEGGGPFERITAVADIDDDVAPPARVAATGTGPSAVAAITMERLFRDQLQPRAYACYQRALGGAPTLAGTAHYTIVVGRGEITQVQLQGLGHPTLDACLREAGFTMTLPLPDLAFHQDDQTVARYPLTLRLSDSRPIVVIGDADSSAPIDIDAIEGGVPAVRRPVRVDARTPLGGLRPSQP